MTQVKEAKLVTLRKMPKVVLVDVQVIPEFLYFVSHWLTLRKSSVVNSIFYPQVFCCYYGFFFLFSVTEVSKLFLIEGLWIRKRNLFHEL